MAHIAGVRLPQELWDHIFSYLTTSDVINFCKTSSEYAHFLGEIPLVRNFNVSGNYDFFNTNIYTYVTENVSYEYIKVLNINKLYWVKLEDLRRLLKILPNLEELLALNTALSFRPKDVLLYGKLKTLALSVEGNHFTNYVDPTIYRNNLYLLRKLCLHVTRKNPKGFMGMHMLFNELFALNELWIFDSDDSHSQPLKFDTIVSQLKFLKKLVIKSKIYIPLLDYKPFGLAKYFQTRRFESIAMRYETLPVDKVVPFRHVSIFEPVESKLEMAWNVFRSYRSEMPYDHMAHREIYLTKKINNVNFQELNFIHNKCFCTNDYVNASWDFLSSDNSKDLRKLSIKSCVLQRRPVSKGDTIDRLQREYPIEAIIKNCPKVTTLELMHCPKCNVTIIDAYPLICNWKCLERIMLDVPAYLNGAFLVDLAKTCTNLKFLRISSHNTNENLNRSVYKALPHANQLQDFCFENKAINIPVLFGSFSTSQKLRRVFVSCEDTAATSTNTLKSFLETNPQLVLLALVITFKPKSYIKTVQDILDRFRQPDSAKRFHAKNDIRFFLDNYSLYEANSELFKWDTEVSTVDFYSFR
ncbi:uncharacterized protein LOC109535678 isoform X2 [Dendroctonus ponderosae]|uniref:F-box domain-containing protein n=1 Tax=Dendroctonus ponderosae TaxID=77166 RepID=A0AAR5P7V2_DENPD|nr:uncharacterized protein LOC109535678 isoform X2 [Dendroctonus ponderosae]